MVVHGAMVCRGSIHNLVHDSLHAWSVDKCSGSLGAGEQRFR